MEFFTKEKASDADGKVAVEVSRCCPATFCDLIERVSEEYRVALIRGLLVWIIGVAAWAISIPLALLSLGGLNINFIAVLTIFVVLGVAFVLGVVAYGVLSIDTAYPPHGQKPCNKRGSYSIIILGLIVGASFGLPRVGVYVYEILVGGALSLKAFVSLAFVLGVMGVMVLTAYKLRCSPCLCPFQCIPAVAYALAAISIGHSLTIGIANELTVLSVGFLILRGLFLVLAAVTLSLQILACVENLCVPVAISVVVSAVSRAIASITVSLINGPLIAVNLLLPILFPFVLLFGFYALWSLLKCGCGVVTERGIVAALSSSVIPVVLVFSLPLLREVGGVVAYTVVPVLVATAAVILLSQCIFCAEDCIALLLMVASIGAYAYGIVAASTTYYEVFLVLSINGFQNDYTIARGAAAYLAIGLLLLTVLADYGWPRRCAISRITAARSLIFSAVGAGLAVLFASFASYVNLVLQVGPSPVTALVEAILAWLPIAGSALSLATSCCAAETFGGIGVAFGSVAFAKGFGLYSVYTLLNSSANVIPAWLVLLPIVVAVGVAIISGFLAKIRCGLCPRDSLAAFATGLSIIPLSNIFEAIPLGLNQNSLQTTVITALANVLPFYEVVAYLAAFVGLYYFAAPLLTCKDSPLNCCDILSASPAFLAPAFLVGVLVNVVFSAFLNGAAALQNAQWPALAAAILFSGLIFGVFVPIAIRLYSGKGLSCQSPAFSCSWPKDIITFAIAAIFFGRFVFAEQYRLGQFSSSLVTNLVVSLDDLFGTLLSDAIPAFFTALFGWLAAPLVLDAFLLFIDSADQVATVFLLPLRVFEKCIGLGSLEQLALAVASALALYALVFWQNGSEVYFSTILKSSQYQYIVVFGWYLVLLALLALIAASAVLLRFDSSSPYSEYAVNLVKQWIN